MWQNIILYKNMDTQKNGNYTSFIFEYFILTLCVCVYNDVRTFYIKNI